MLFGGAHMAERPLPSAYVDSAVTGGGGGSTVNIAVPAAALKDDICFILGTASSGGAVTAGGAGGWSSIGSGGNFILWKKLATADLGATLTITGTGGMTSEPLMIAVYRGGDLLTRRAENPGGSSPLNYAGLAKSRTSRALIAIWGVEPGLDSLSGVPTNFTDRQDTQAGGVGSVSLMDAIAYVDNASMTWTWTGGHNAGVIFLEIT